MRGNTCASESRMVLVLLRLIGWKNSASFLRPKAQRCNAKPTTFSKFRWKSLTPNSQSYLIIYVWQSVKSTSTHLAHSTGRTVEPCHIPPFHRPMMWTPVPGYQAPSCFAVPVTWWITRQHVLRRNMHTFSGYKENQLTEFICRASWNYDVLAESHFH